MADAPSAWGIEIGQAGLKAIKLRNAEVAGQVIAAAFDYVPHSKLLSQPDANPEELIREAMTTFLSRNQIAGDLIAISVPGQSSLAKFIQLPPVEQSKVAQIVKYEATQQIPFPLDEVIWDWQPMGGTTEEGGFMLDAEVGLFAMKREQVQQQMKPFVEKKVELELIQIAPLAVYNYLCYDRLGMRKGTGPSDPEEFTIVLDMGCDATTLMVTNGRKIWIRNVPIGGSHFTRVLTKDMKLTFAKAEHLKCNATRSPDPRAVFQSMRPVFQDYVTEIQRSIGFFSSTNRQAKITRVVGVGNGFKLAGLQKFLQQSLSYEVDRVESFQGIVGDHVLTAPLFQDNLLTFAVPYGLALQALGVTDIHTSLLPPEILLDRKIRRKKPWALLTAASLMTGLAISAFGYGLVFSSVAEGRFGAAETKATQIADYAGKLKKEHADQVGRNERARVAGDKLVQNLSTREYWLEVYKAIDECLPRDVGVDQDITDPRLKNVISLKSITAKRMGDVSQWYSNAATLPDIAKKYMIEEDQKAGPKGPGYIFTLVGHHFHEGKNPATEQGMGYVLNTLLKNLQQYQVKREDPHGREPTFTPVGKLGISHATILRSHPPYEVMYYPKGRGGANPSSMAPAPTRGGFVSDFPINPGPVGSPTGSRPLPPVGNPTTPPDDDPANRPFRIRVTEFVLQFAWVPTPEDKRKLPPVPVAPPVDPNAPAPGTVPAVAPGAVAPAPAGTAPGTVPPIGQPPVGTPLSVPANTIPANTIPAPPVNPAAPAAPVTTTPQ